VHAFGPLFPRPFGFQLCVSGNMMFSARHISVKRYCTQNTTEYILARMMQEQRPWGSFTVLDESDSYKVKRIEVLPQKRLSYQRHEQRAEHWMVVAGEAKVTLDGRDIRVVTGGVVDVPIGAAHRIENVGAGSLIFIEIQRGSYFGEDDIQRLQDDYGRLK
jgi:mannose-6-phosphate isomerase